MKAKWCCFIFVPLICIHRLNCLSSLLLVCFGSFKKSAHTSHSYNSSFFHLLLSRPISFSLTIRIAAAALTLFIINRRNVSRFAFFLCFVPLRIIARILLSFVCLARKKESLFPCFPAFLSLFLVCDSWLMTTCFDGQRKRKEGKK